MTTEDALRKAAREVLDLCDRGSAWPPYWQRAIADLRTALSASPAVGQEPVAPGFVLPEGCVTGAILVQHADGTRENLDTVLRDLRAFRVAAQVGQEAEPVAQEPVMPLDHFAAWFAREVPPGTVINDPAWWSPRIYRAIVRATDRETERSKAIEEDAARIDWMQSWTEGDVALMGPGQHGGPRDAWLVALDSDKRDSGTRGYRWSCEGHGKDLREAIDNCRASLTTKGSGS